MSNDTVVTSEAAQILTAIGGLGGLLGAIGAIILGLMNKSSADKAKSDAGQAKTEADKAKEDATTAKADAHAAMTKALDAIQKAEDAQTKAQVGWLELQLRMYLSSRRDKIHEVTRDLESLRAGRRPDEFSDADKVRMKDIMLRFFSAHEDFLGALEQACRHHQDEKIDAAAFRRMYDDEVRTVCEAKEDSPFHKFLHPKDTAKFRAIWATYKKWFDLG